MGSPATTRVTARVTMATTKAAATTAAATTTAATTAAATTAAATTEEATTAASTAASTAAAASMAARAKLKVTFDRWEQLKRSVQVIDFNLFPTVVKVLAKCLQIIFTFL
jgi:hypothetical protein